MGKLFKVNLKDILKSFSSGLWVIVLAIIILMFTIKTSNNVFDNKNIIKIAGNSFGISVLLLSSIILNSAYYGGIKTKILSGYSKLQIVLSYICVITVIQFLIVIIVPVVKFTFESCIFGASLELNINRLLLYYVIKLTDIFKYAALYVALMMNGIKNGRYRAILAEFFVIFLMMKIFRWDNFPDIYSIMNPSDIQKIIINIILGSLLTIGAHKTFKLGDYE